MAASSQNPNHVTPSPNPPYDMNPYFRPPPPSQSDLSYVNPQQFSFHNPNYPQHPLQNHQLNLPQRSLSYPTPPFQPSPNAGGAQIMALLRTPSSSSNPESALPSTAMEYPGGLVAPTRKVPRGRRMTGDLTLLEYDIDVRMPGEAQPQLEVTPITKYISDPQLFVGRQIAVNKSYICYGLKQGNVRVLNSNNASRALFRGHGQRVTDMAFFAEDVHLLASVSIDGRVYVWKISEDPEQITGNIIISVQIVGEGKVLHPRVCWHSHKQEILVVGIGGYVLRIDTTKFGKGEVYSTETPPPQCHVEKLIEGIQLVGKHDGEVTDLSMCQWMVNRLVSASMDGTIKIWEDRKVQPLAVLRPHDGDPVYSASFLTSSDRPEHIILITGGPLNREMKIWSSSNDEGWLLPSDADSWKCTQTLRLKSSAAAQVEDAFFNQVASLSNLGLLLLANAKRNAIYVIHIEYGPNPAASHMDYIAEFTVTMPILSFTGISAMLPHGVFVPQVYCFQTQAIQQYTLDLYQCLPPPLENDGLEISRSSVSHDVSISEEITSLESSDHKPEVPFAGSAPRLITQVSSSDSGISVRYPIASDSFNATSLPDVTTPKPESKPVSLACATSDTGLRGINSQLLAQSPVSSRNPSGLRMLTDSLEPSNEQRGSAVSNLSDLPSLDKSLNNESKGALADATTTLLTFKNPTHLITPPEIVMPASSPNVIAPVEGNTERDADIRELIVGSNVGNTEVDVKVVGETSTDDDELEPIEDLEETQENSLFSASSDIRIDAARESGAISEDNTSKEEPQQADIVGLEFIPKPLRPGDETVQDFMKDEPGNSFESILSTAATQLPALNSKGKKQKGKNSQGTGSSSPSPSPFTSMDNSSGPGWSSNLASIEAVVQHVVTKQQTMQQNINQVMDTQKEILKQLSNMAATPFSKECRRQEASLGRIIEKSGKANSDALWARIQEDNTKAEKFLRDFMQQFSNLTSDLVIKDSMPLIEKVVKKEIAAIGSRIIPSIEKTVSSSIAESFQRGVGDRAVNQLDKSVHAKLEATVARNIQTQFQTSGKQAIQDCIPATIETSLLPGFEAFCKAMFGQIDTAFQKGMLEHTTAVQQHLAVVMRDTITSSLSTVTQTLSGELAEGQRKLAALATAGVNSNALNPLVTQLSNSSLSGRHEKVEEPKDPKHELTVLISECKYDEAFMRALQTSDLSIVSWLCYQVDLQALMSKTPLALSQGVLLSLLQHLACDINRDTPRKLGWMSAVALAINPADPTIYVNSVHLHNIIDQVNKILHNLLLVSSSASDQTSIRSLLYIINTLMLKM